jgi:SAM-dependent methyltransferase
MNVGDLAPTARQELVDAFYWYHSIRFPDGVASRGTVDHDAFFDRYGFPSVAGRTVLDVGASDGYFSFALARLGAARVVATDVDRWSETPAFDLPRRTRARRLGKYRPEAGEEAAFERRLEIARRFGFERPNPFYLARALLEAPVELRYMPVYDLPSLGEKFDVVFVGTITTFIADLLGAFEAVYEVTRERAVIACADCLDFESLSGARWAAFHAIRALRLAGGLEDHVSVAREDAMARFTANTQGAIWRPSVACVCELLLSAGFRDVVVHTRFALPNLRRGTAMKHVIFHAYV